MSTASQKRRMKVLQGYVKSPPRCINCRNYQPPTHAADATPLRPAIAYSPPRCALGSFAVMPHAICTSWVDGRILEAA